MEQIIANFFVADNEVIKKARADLLEAYKRPETITELHHIVVSQGQVEIRRFAAMILNRRLEKLRNWRQVPTEQREIIKQDMFDALVAEREKPVRRAIAQLLGCLIGHEAEKNDGWMEKIMDFIYKSVGSADPEQIQLGASTFNVMANAALYQFLPKISDLFPIYNAALVAAQQSGNMAQPAIYHLILGMTYLVPMVLGNNVAEATCQSLLPLLLQSLTAFAAKGDPVEFYRVFGILECMAHYTPKLLKNNIRLLLEFCLGIANNKEMHSSIRNKAVSYISWLVHIKKKDILKQEMLKPTLRVLFDLMSEETKDEDCSNPMNGASQTLDVLAINLPAKKIIPPLVQLLKPALKGQDPWRKRAAYMSMAIISEGCSEVITQKYLEVIVKIIKVGITAPEAIVRNAAFFALDQFAEHLQPDISTYANEILPILSEFLKKLASELDSGNTETKHIERIFSALESFCENMEEGPDQHLPILMERLFNLMKPNYPPRVRELVMRAIDVITLSSKSQMLHYLQQIMTILRPYMAITGNEDIVNLRPQAIESLSSVALAIGKEHFYPLANDIMPVTLSLLDNADDPELRRALYNLIASLSSVVEGEMSAVLPRIMDRIMESVTQTGDMMPDEDIPDEGVPHIPSPPPDAEIDIEDSHDEDDESVLGFSVENAYLDEKESAILLLKEFAENAGSAFLPYVEKAYEQVYALLDHPHADIRRASEDALVSFIIALYKGQNLEHATKALIELITKINELVHQDDEISVAQGGLQGLMEILSELKESAFPNREVRETIFSCIHDVLVGKVACQCNDDEDNEEDGGESEYVELLVELAQTTLSFFGKAMKPAEFLNFFQRIYPKMLQRLKTGKEDENLAHFRRSFYGTIVECLAPLDQYACNYFGGLCSLLTKGLKDEDDMARQNAALGLGELVLACKARSYSSYPVILIALWRAVKMETNPAVLDNMCGAVARLIINNVAMVPLQRVLPLLLRGLPLKENFNENSSIIKCFRALIHESPVTLQNVIVEQIITVCIHILFKKEYTEDVVPDKTVELLLYLKDAYSEAFDNVVSWKPEVLNVLQENVQTPKH